MFDAVRDEKNHIPDKKDVWSSEAARSYMKSH